MRLPRPWPLLGDHQSPEDLAARVAFHVHRLGITTTSLRALGLSRELARSVREGRLPLGNTDIKWLSLTLALENSELTRSLTTDERAEWNFYRVSARHPVEVWKNAARAWRHRLSLPEVSELVGHEQASIKKVVAGRRQRPVLTHGPAVRLATALNLENGADAFFFELPPHPR